MKRIIPFFVVSLGLSVFQTGVAFCADVARSSVNRSGVVSVRQKSVQNRDGTTNSRTAKNNVSGVRLTTNTNSNNSSRQTVVRTRTDNTTQKNTAGASRAATTRVISRRPVYGKNTSRAPTRALELDAEKIASIKSQDYSKCKNVYYSCMDEFCATKDTGLRRCACSSRIHEFDAIKQQLSDAEDKMLDFNQRLLVVGLDKEDAAAINVASEGELGYSIKDMSASEKLLKKMTDNLNSSGDSKINNDLSAVSLSLNIDSAWDSIDSMGASAMTSKSGVGLYNAARPICIEMAKEVCSDHELEVTQNSYQLSIQQDCDTVAKSYDTKYNQAMEKIHESSALLDMSRLNAYQQRNSDDILTCKKKILDKLSDSSVCGENLHKCLDVSGQYIDPSTGNAFLSSDLYAITNLLTAPAGNITWSNVPQNQQFVTFLNSKKVFLKSATQQCQDIAESVWTDFLDDALAQIKLAQNAKLEEIRQSCTTLVSQCKSASRQSLLDFDARALSTFEVIADSTINTICADVENSCVSLLRSTGGGDEMWQSGMSEIARDTSYDAIINNCTTVGRDCIIQQCNGAAGNFALCGDYQAMPRRAILTRQACWDKVFDCVNQSINLSKIASIVQERSDFYNTVYNLTSLPDDPCSAYSGDDETACRITEQIWGGCEHNPESTLITTNESVINQFNINNISASTSNKILIPSSDEYTSLLAWLATNTGTTEDIDSCSAYNCPVNYKYDTSNQQCNRIITENTVLTDNKVVATMDQIMYVTSSITNACVGGNATKDMYDNCCASNDSNAVVVSNGICVPAGGYNAILVQQVACDSSVQLTNPPSYYCADYTQYPANCSGDDCTYIAAQKDMALYCVTTESVLQIDDNGYLNCQGYLVLVDEYGNYIPPFDAANNQQLAGPIMSYKPDERNTCEYSYYTNSSSWGWRSRNNGSCDHITDVVPKENEFMITYPSN